MIQYARLPAIVTLLLILGPGAIFFLCSRQSDASYADSSQLAKLQTAISAKDPKPSDWLAYAQTLQNLKRYGDASWAFAELLKLEPGNRQARLQGAVCVALTKNSGDFATIVEQTIKADPRLAVDLLRRPEAQPYLASEKFQELQRTAQAQAMD